MSCLDLTNLSPEQNVRLNNIADEIRKEFNAVVENVSMPHINNINWIVGNIASRNKYTSPLFMRLCFLAFVEAELLHNRTIDLLIVADGPFARFLKVHFKRQNKTVHVQCIESLLFKLWRVLRPLRQYLIGCGIIFLRYIARTRKSINRLSVNTVITLVDTFVLNNKGDEGGLVDGKYQDRYYPGLLENLTAEERENIYFIPTMVGFKNPLSIYPRVRKAGNHFLIHDDFLKLSDYARALLQPLYLLRCKITKTSFRGIDITPLLKQEHLEKCCEIISLFGILYYRFAYRLAENKIKVKLLVEWYENQVIDRGMIVGFHRFHLDTKVIGYQGYIIAKSLHLYIYPNNTEYLGKAVPDIVYVVGEALKDSLYEFCENIVVDVAPGFRFHKMWRERRFYPELNFYTVLVGLPIALNDSAHILHLLAKTLQQIKDEKIRFWIKPHPTWSIETIKSLLPGAWPNHFLFKTGDFHDVIESSNLLISNASSVSLEALVKGVPVIIIGAQTGITQNPIPENIAQDRWKIVYESIQLVENIKKFREISVDCLQDGNEQNAILKKKFFEPVTRQSVLKFLELQ